MPDQKNDIVEPLCLSCLHSVGWDWGECTAFPFGIPQEILDGKFDHHERFSDDDLLVYQPLA